MKNVEIVGAHSGKTRNILSRLAHGVTHVNLSGITNQ